MLHSLNRITPSSVAIAIGALIGGCAANSGNPASPAEGALGAVEYDAGDGGAPVFGDASGSAEGGGFDLPDVTAGDSVRDGGSGGGQDAQDAIVSPIADASQGGRHDAAIADAFARGGDSAAAGGDATASGDGGPPGVRIIGRTAPGTAGARFEWPGVSIAARFSGTQASIQLNDGNNQNEFEVVVDGKTSNNVVTVSGQTTYAVATGLANGTHDLLIWRRTEAYYNATEFLGLTNFGPGGALLSPPPAPNRRLEVIGDSISCGYGIEGMPGCTAGTTNENNYLAYGSVAARALGADVVTIAWSGIGMYRNYSDVGPSANPMPARYDFVIPTDTSPTTWDFSKYQPHAVIINLGTNDFSTHGDPGQPYIDAYVNFVKHVRSKYAKAYIFCVIQWPPSGADIDQAVGTLKAGGETMIESFDISVTAGGSGCDGHPDVAKSNAMGGKLAAEIQRVLGW